MLRNTANLSLQNFRAPGLRLMYSIFKFVLFFARFLIIQVITIIIHICTREILNFMSVLLFWFFLRLKNQTCSICFSAAGLGLRIFSHDYFDICSFGVRLSSSELRRSTRKINENIASLMVTATASTAITVMVQTLIASGMQSHLNSCDFCFVAVVYSIARSTNYFHLNVAPETFEMCFLFVWLDFSSYSVLSTLIYMPKGAHDTHTHSIARTYQIGWECEGAIATVRK